MPTIESEDDPCAKDGIFALKTIDTATNLVSLGDFDGAWLVWVNALKENPQNTVLWEFINRELYSWQFLWVIPYILKSFIVSSFGIIIVILVIFFVWRFSNKKPKLDISTFNVEAEMDSSSASGDNADTPPLAKQLQILLEHACLNPPTDVELVQLDVIDKPLQENAWPDLAPVLPSLDGFMKMLSNIYNALVVKDIVTVNCWLLEDPSKGVGISTRLIDYRSKKLWGGHTLWECDFTEDYISNKLNPKDVRYKKLIDPAVFWIYWIYCKNTISKRALRRAFGTDDDQSFMFWQCSIELQKHRKQSRKTDEMLRKALEADPDNIVALLNLGRLTLRSDRAESEKYFNKVIELTENHESLLPHIFANYRRGANILELDIFDPDTEETKIAEAKAEAVKAAEAVVAAAVAVAAKEAAAVVKAKEAVANAEEVAAKAKVAVANAEAKVAEAKEAKAKEATKAAEAKAKEVKEGDILVNKLKDASEFLEKAVHDAESIQRKAGIKWSWNELIEGTILHCLLEMMSEQAEERDNPEKIEESISPIAKDIIWPWDERIEYLRRIKHGIPKNEFVTDVIVDMIRIPLAEAKGENPKEEGIIQTVERRLHTAPRVLYNLACYYTKKDIKKALEYLEAAVRADPTYTLDLEDDPSLKPLRKNIVISKKYGKTCDALEALYIMACYYSAHGFFDKALKCLELIVSSDPTYISRIKDEPSLRPFHESGSSQVPSQNNPRDNKETTPPQGPSPAHIEKYNKLINDYTTPKVFYDLACHYSKQEEFEEALEYLEETIRADPTYILHAKDDPSLQSLREKCKADEKIKNRYDKACTAPVALFNLACHYSKQEKFEKALEYLEEAIRADPTRILHIEGDISFNPLREKCKTDEKTKARYDKACNMPKALYGLACYYSEQYGFKEANDDLKQAMEYLKKAFDADATYILKIKDEPSLQSLRKACEKDGNIKKEFIKICKAPGVLYNLACDLSAQKEFEKALGYLESAICSDSTYIAYLYIEPSLQALRKACEEKEELKKRYYALYTRADYPVLHNCISDYIRLILKRFSTRRPIP